MLASHYDASRTPKERQMRFGIFDHPDDSGQPLTRRSRTG